MTEVTENRRRQREHQYGRVSVGVAVVEVEPQRGQEWPAGHTGDSPVRPRSLVIGTIKEYSQAIREFTLNVDVLKT